MKINRDNYEAFLLDLQEGQLSADEEKHLHDFLLLNPDCDIRMNDMTPWTLEESGLVYPERELLKKQIPSAFTPLSEHNFDLFSIARMEGDLTAQQEESHQAMLVAEPEKQEEWKRWQQSKLLAEKVVFEGKANLKRNSRRKMSTIWLRVASAAAAVALLVALLRMEPPLPMQELTTESSAETNTVQAAESKTEQAIEAIEEPVQNLPVQELPVQASTRANTPSLFSVKRGHERPLESQVLSEVPVMDDLQARALPIAAHFSEAPAVLALAVPDRIEVLDTPPVQIHLSSLSVKQLADVDLQEVFDDYTADRELSLWTVANAGIKGINKITGSDISLLASRDDEGEVSGFSLKSKRLSVTRPLARRE